MKIAILSIAFLCSGLVLSAQDIPFKKDNFPGQRKELKQAKKQMKKGKRLASKGIQRHQEAIYLLQSAHTFNPNNASLNFMIGELLFQGDDPHLALPYFAKAYALNMSIDPDIQYFMGRTYHLNHEFALAGQFYQAYAKQLKNRDFRRMTPEIRMLVRQTEIGDSLKRQPVNGFVENLGDRINSQWPEYAPILIHSGQRLYFTSRRPGGTGGKLDREYQYYEDIYYLQKLGSVWSDPINAGVVLNSESHESVVGVSQDDKILYIRRGNPGWDIFAVKVDDKKQKKPRELPRRISGKGNENWITFSPDSSRVWFVSDRKRGHGGKDIWMCEAKRSGRWRRAVNAGPMINTAQDEASPFIAADGKTLYFSSKGLPGIGGYDIYKTTWADGAYTVPVNLGFPINSASDDLHFSMDGYGKLGYLASSRPGGSGNYDLYRVKIMEDAKDAIPFTEPITLHMKIPDAESIAPLPPVETGVPVVMIKGTIQNKQTSALVDAEISAIAQKDGAVLVTGKSGDPTGQFMMTLPVGSDCWLHLSAPGYLPFNAPLPLNNVDPYSVYSLELSMNPIVAGQGFDLPRLTFKINLATFQKNADLDIDQLIEFMKVNPTVTIAIQGYVIPGEDEQVLSAKRAEAIRQFLLRAGVEDTRVVADDPMYNSAMFQDTPIAPNMGSLVRIVILSVD
jgi:tetratricopeptide (TPR) repeat protein